MKKKQNLIIAVMTVLSGIILGITYNYFVHWLGWICYVGIFYTMIKYSIKPIQAFIIGLITSTIQGVIVFSWMIKVLSHYSGNDTNIGILFTIITAIVFAIKTGVFFAIASYLINKCKNIKTIVPATIAIGSAYIILDRIYEYMFQEIPWIFHFLGYTQSTNLYTAQLSEIAGIIGISFIVLLCNLLIAYAIVNRNKQYLMAVIGIIVISHIYGYIRIDSINSKEKESISIAMICDNTTPEIRWNEQRVNEYVSTLLALNKEAIESNPDIILWNEGVIPWSYREDDDLINVIIDQTKNSKSHHIISLFTDEKDGSFNSAYLFDNHGYIEGRYDKNKLLGGMEKPLWDNKHFELPFMNAAHNSIMKSGKKIAPIISSQLGTIGVMICNESLTESTASMLATQGAGFLVLMANDNWFANTELVNTHFLCTRMRAIETRKDIVVNTNMGYCGVIRASGEIKSKEMSDKAHVLLNNVEINNTNSNSGQRANIFVLMAIFTIIISIVFILKKA